MRRIPWGSSGIVLWLLYTRHAWPTNHGGNGLRRQSHRRAGEEAISEPLALRLTDAAEADLAESGVGTRFIRDIKAAFEPVRHLPLAAPGREQPAPGLRVTFHKAYAIYYRPLPDALIIVRVLHGARDVGHWPNVAAFLRARSACR